MIADIVKLLKLNKDEDRFNHINSKHYHPILNQLTQ